jgi:hypothetical protein
MQAGARTLGVELHVLRASTEREIDEVFAGLVQKRVGALVINPDPLFRGRIEQLVALTARYAMPTIYNREFAAAGGLLGVPSPGRHAGPPDLEDDASSPHSPPGRAGGAGSGRDPRRRRPPAPAAASP